MFFPSENPSPQKNYLQVYVNKRTCFQLIGRRATDPGGGAAETRTGTAKGDPGQGEETVRGAEEEVPNGSSDGKVKRRLVRGFKKNSGWNWMKTVMVRVCIMQLLPPVVILC